MTRAELLDRATDDGIAIFGFRRKRRLRGNRDKSAQKAGGKYSLDYNPLSFRLSDFYQSQSSHSHHHTVHPRHPVYSPHPNSTFYLASVMALFGLLGGGGAQQPAPEQPREHTTSADLFASTNFSQSQNQQQPQPGSSFIPDPPAAGPSTPQAPAPQLPSALDTFSSAYDPAKLHPLAGLGQNLDFLQLDEDKLTDMEGAASVLPSRGWTDDLCVGTGTTYVSGEFGVSFTIPDSLACTAGPASQ